MNPKKDKDQRDESELWKKIIEGNQEAFASLFYKYHQILFNYGYKIVPRKVFIEDCIQELFLTIWEKHETISDAKSVKAYLFTSMRRMVFKNLRKIHNQNNRNIRYAKEKDELSFSIEDYIIENERHKEHQKKLQIALRALSRRGREVIYLKYFSGMSNSEIASLMEIKRQSVYNHVSEAIDNMQHSVS